jgi:hypothetical protein
VAIDCFLFCFFALFFFSFSFSLLYPSSHEMDKFDDTDSARDNSTGSENCFDLHSIFQLFKRTYLSLRETVADRYFPCRLLFFLISKN